MANFANKFECLRLQKLKEEKTNKEKDLETWFDT